MPNESSAAKFSVLEQLQARHRTTQRVYVHTRAIDIKKRMEELS